MNVEDYLVKQGWKKGQPLRPGGIKNPILVTHKYDNKGLGFNPQASEGWWERVFDGHLKALDFSGTKKNAPAFEFDEEKRIRSTSPLYAHFRSSGMLEGTITPPVVDQNKNNDGTAEKVKKHTKSDKSDKKHKKSKKERKNNQLRSENKDANKGSKSGQADESKKLEKDLKKRKRNREKDGSKKRKIH